MIILSQDNRSIEFTMDEKVTLSENRRYYVVTVPKIQCTSRTDADKMQEKVNTFVYNLAHEMLNLDRKMTPEEAEELAKTKKGE